MSMTKYYTLMRRIGYSRLESAIEVTFALLWRKVRFL